RRGGARGARKRRAGRSPRPPRRRPPALQRRPPPRRTAAAGIPCRGSAARGPPRRADPARSARPRLSAEGFGARIGRFMANHKLYGRKNHCCNCSKSTAKFLPKIVARVSLATTPELAAVREVCNAKVANLGPAIVPRL